MTFLLVMVVVSLPLGPFEAFPGIFPVVVLLWIRFRLALGPPALPVILFLFPGPLLVAVRLAVEVFLAAPARQPELLALMTIVEVEQVDVVVQVELLVVVAAAVAVAAILESWSI